MKTRFEYWQEYRDEINKNNFLFPQLKNSHNQLQILYKKLIKIFPEYVNHFSVEEKMNLAFKQIPSYQKYDLHQVKILIEKFNTIDNNILNLDVSNKINFSSQKLDDVIKEVKRGRLEEKDYVTSIVSKDISLAQTQLIKLAEPQIKDKLKKEEILQIAIDGPSGCGKSTTAKIIAKKYNLKYINSGLIYRVITYFLLKNKVNIKRKHKVVKYLKKINITLLNDDEISINNQKVHFDHLMQDLISRLTSIVAVILEVRKFVVNFIQKTWKNKNVIIDGRDTTYRILPHANLKFFIKTSLEVRAQRRMLQNSKIGQETNYKKVLKDLEKRDEIDINRKNDPLKVVEDAIVIDTSQMSLDQTVDKISEYIDKYKSNLAKQKNVKK